MTEDAKGTKCIAAVRIRGVISARREARETLQMLHLTRNNYAVLIDNRPSFLGMLQAARGYVTWGEPSEEVIAALVQKRGKLSGNKKLTEEHIEKAGYKSMAELAKAIFDCHVVYWKLPNIQVVFKLRPPSKGYKGNIKKGFRGGGELGYRGEKINDLMKRMI